MNLVTNELTIIIIFYEEKIDLVFKCLENIKNFKIIIIDNADNISLKKKIKEKFQIYKYLLNKKNIGFTKAANQAIKLCDTEYVLNLNADCFISEEDILKLGGVGQIDIFEALFNTIKSRFSFNIVSALFNSLGPAPTAAPTIRFFD